MYVEEVKYYKLHIPTGDVFNPVIVETTRELLMCAYSIVNGYVHNGRVRKTDAIKAVRQLTKDVSGHPWGLKATKLFVEDVMEDEYYSIPSLLNELFYEKEDK